jgi:hypothetical protein
MEINGNIATKLSEHDIKILQSISIGLRGMRFLAENGKQTMENYLFIDCGEKLDPNNVLHECYHQYSSISGEELENFASKIDKICFPNGIDENSSIFDELTINKSGTDLTYEKKEKIKPPINLKRKIIKKDSKNHYRKYPEYNEINNNYKSNEHKEDFGYDRTLYKLGHLSMNPKEEPFLGDDA